MTQPTQVVITLQAVFEEFPDILLVTVFGSAATGDLRKDSNIDIAVAAEAQLSFERKTDVYLALSEAFNREEVLRHG